MLEMGIANITMFFAIAGVCVVFIITWMIKSESRINSAKEEIRRLREKLETDSREKFALLEKVSMLENSSVLPPASAEKKDTGNGMSKKLLEDALKKNESLLKSNNELKKDNDRLRKEAAEAKSSLEEVYKELSSQ